MHDRYPAYNVLDKRHTPSWNEQTRRVIDQRLAMRRDPQFFSEQEWDTLGALCDRIVPQPKDRAPVPIAVMIDNKMAENMIDGHRDSRLPKMQEAWRIGLRALDEESLLRFGRPFHRIDAAE